MINRPDISLLKDVFELTLKLADPQVLMNSTLRGFNAMIDETEKLIEQDKAHLEELIRDKTGVERVLKQFQETGEFDKEGLFNYLLPQELFKNQTSSAKEEVASYVDNLITKLKTDKPQ